MMPHARDNHHAARPMVANTPGRTSVTEAAATATLTAPRPRRAGCCCHHPRQLQKTRTRTLSAGTRLTGGTEPPKQAVGTRGPWRQPQSPSRGTAGVAVTGAGAQSHPHPGSGRRSRGSSRTAAPPALQQQQRLVPILWTHPRHWHPLPVKQTQWGGDPRRHQAEGNGHPLAALRILGLPERQHRHCRPQYGPPPRHWACPEQKEGSG